MRLKVVALPVDRLKRWDGWRYRLNIVVLSGVKGEQIHTEGWNGDAVSRLRRSGRTGYRTVLGGMALYGRYKWPLWKGIRTHFILAAKPFNA